MDLLAAIAFETLRTMVLAAPFLLLGLLMAGLLHVLLPTSVIQRWMGRQGLSGVTMAALIGVPLPVCSCGVVPISVELRRKGASAPASQSFLITTPESSVDSILFTYALMGPVLAIARPVAAFFTALVGGVAAIAYMPRDEWDAGREVPLLEEAEDDGRALGEGSKSATETEADADAELAADDHHHHDCDDHHDGHDHHHHHHGHHDHDHDCDDHSHSISYEQAPEALAALGALGRRLTFRRRPEDAHAPGVWNTVVRPSLRYGFGELLDDLAFWLVLGVVLAGVIGALMPADLGERGLGSGILPMLLMLVVGVPIYMCASASTPIAAALMAKGISPGAALVFLLAGPATNAATLVLLGRTFGRRFVQIYLASVVIGALAAGIVLDALAFGLGWQLMAPLVDGSSAGFGLFDWVFMALLSVLLVRSFGRGSWSEGMAELRSGFAGIAPDAETWRRWRPRLVIALVVVALVGYLATGLFSIAPGSQGYAFRFGALAAADLEPGLHWNPPAPLGTVRSWRVEYPRKSDIGFKTDLQLLAQRKELARYANPDEWHSTVAAMNTNLEQATYLTADENLVEMSFTVHYGLNDPTAFFVGLDHRHDLVGLFAEAAARQFLAGNVLEDLLTTRRQEIEAAIHQTLAERLDGVGAGVSVTAVRIVDIHPPSGAVFAFRDVSSASEDKQTRIHEARQIQSREIPRARGEAEAILIQIRAESEARATEARGSAAAFTDRAEVIARHRRLLEHLLWLESAERTLAGREKIVVPPGTSGTDVTLWREEPQK